MSIDPDVLDALLAAGASAEMIVAAVKADAAKEEGRRAEKRSRDAERKRRSRASAMSRGHGVTDADGRGHTVTARDIADPVPPKESSPTPPKENSPHPETTDADASVVGGADATGPDEVVLAFDAYNAEAPAAGWPKAKVLDARRRAALKARLAECGGIAGWRDVLAKARASPHLTGDNTRGWRADLDFLLQAKSFTKLREGSYDARRPSPAGNGRRPSAHDSMLAGFAEVAARYGGSGGLHGAPGEAPGEPPPFDGPTLDLEAGRGGHARDAEPWPDAGDYRGGGAAPRRLPGH